MHQSFIELFFFIFTGASILAAFVLYTKQPLLIAYIGIGVILGPSGVAVVTDPDIISNLSHVGIVFLLFLIGLDLKPRNIMASFKTALVVVPLASLGIVAIAFPLTMLFQFPLIESLIIAVSLIFSSTIIGIKLLPTTVLHHKHTGELVVALLLVQDLLAVLTIIIVDSKTKLSLIPIHPTLAIIISLPLLLVIAFYGVRWVLLPFLQKFDRFQEFLFLVTIGWCLGIAELAHVMGLSYEIGAFVAGVSLTQSPVCHFVTGSLKPLRDFFLILFFFSLGAGFDLHILAEVIIPALALAGLITLLKPTLYAYCLKMRGEKPHSSWEIGFRLGQVSEFSLLIAFVAFQSELISKSASHLIQATAILTFIISSYIVVLRYQSPIAISDQLRRD